MTMRQRSLSLMFLLLCFGALQSEAQTIQEVTPENLVSSAQEIKELYNTAIGVSASEIKDFYLQHWNNAQPYSSSCTSPSAVVTDANNEDVSFEWPGSPSGGAQYRVRYLRLSDGQKNTFSTEDDNITLELPNDLYLFTFQKGCGGFGSSLNIIIIEKPIMMGALTNCNCPSYHLIWNAVFDSDTPASYAWNLYNTSQRFFVKIDYLNAPDVSFVAQIQFGSEGPEIVSLNPVCMTNVALNPDDSQLFAYDNETTQGVFGFFHNINPEEGEENPPELSFSVSDGAVSEIGKIYLNICRGSKPRASTANESDHKSLDALSSIHVLKNPTQDFSTIEMELSETSEVDIILANALGQSIRTTKQSEILEKGIHRIAIDLRSLESGIYYCIVKSNATTHTIRLSKF